MFITFYELSADASIIEMLVWFAVHAVLQIIAAIAFVLLLVFAAAEHVFAFFHGRHSFNYRTNATEFSVGAIILAFSIVVGVVSVAYGSLLPVENRWGIAGLAVVVTICTVLLLAGLGTTKMHGAWRGQSIYR